MAKFLHILTLNERYYPDLKIHKCLGGILHLEPTPGCQVSASYCGVGSMNISCKIPNGTVLFLAAKHILYHATTFTHMTCLSFEYKLVLLTIFCFADLWCQVYHKYPNENNILNSTMRSKHSQSEWNDRFKIENFNTFFQMISTNNSLKIIPGQIYQYYKSKVRQDIKFREKK